MPPIKVIHYFHSTAIYAYPAALQRSRAWSSVHSTYPLRYVGLD
jgi:predicted membrane-bound mannosyltransferase